ncbi:hypothetical protein TNCV_2442521 [Trichonephila clavipes]|nr:hypothetical protein TNCV_2442521 [Trichonephila clavipes]
MSISKCKKNISAVPTHENIIEENVHINKAIAAVVPTQEKFSEENVHIKNAIAAAVPTQQKFIEENVHINNAISVAVLQHKKNSLRKISISKCKKKHISISNRPVVLLTGTHGRLVTNGCPRLEGRKTRKTMSGAS